MSTIEHTKPDANGKANMESLLVVIADYANEAQNHKLNIMGIFNEINPPVYPYRLPTMYLVFKLRPQLGEYNTKKTVTVKLMDADGHELMAIPQEITIPDIKGGKRPELQGVIGLNNLEFSKEGTYIFVILVNGDPKGETSIIANPASPQA
jgi:hypothetical protein